MGEKLTKDQVLKVANLGKLEISEVEVEKYRYQLRQILDEIEKIKKLDINEDQIMISPYNNVNVFKIINKSKMLDINEVLKNAPKTNGNYISVPKVLNE